MNRETRVAQAEQIRHLFNGLKVMAFILLIFGLILVGLLYFLEITPMIEGALLLFYGAISAGYLIARGRSILVAVEKPKKSGEQGGSSQP